MKNISIFKVTYNNGTYITITHLSSKRKRKTPYLSRFNSTRDAAIEFLESECYAKIIGTQDLNDHYLIVTEFISHETFISKK